jgi:sn-glycerol 3-phosphate transport system ATP-binding protein
MGTLSLQQVGKTYGRQEILRDISLQVDDGEFVVIVGPSGCGKSSLLRMVAGLEETSAGEISIGQRRMNDLEPAQRNIAMVFQNYALYPHMTVRQNMAYGLRIRNMAQAEIHQRVTETADALELGELLDRKPRHLSGGQRQRVAIGRAIVRNPDVFLFDEPLSNLDAKLRVQMRHELQQLHRRLRTTSLYVTHDQVEAMTLADRMMVLNAGHIEQIGTPKEVYERPASMFVASFIGSPAMNLLQLTAGEAARMLHGAVPMIAQIVLGIRPEHLHPCSLEHAQGVLDVQWVEALGAVTYVHGRYERFNLVMRLDGTVSCQPGARLGFRIPSAHCHWFDSQTGKRINY